MIDKILAAASYDILPEPIKYKTIDSLVLALLTLFYQIMLPIVALYIMYAGFLYVAARGNEDKLKKAHQALTYSLLGAAIILGAALAVRIIQGTIGGLQ